jgi:hypothetical protein
MSKITDAPTMTAEVSNTELTKSRRRPPAYRKPNQTRGARLRQELTADLVAKLGGRGRISLIQLQDVHRVADLTLLCQTARADLLAGKATIGDVVKLEGTCARAMKRLNLPERGRSKSALRYGRAEPVPTLQDYLAGRQAEDE